MDLVERQKSFEDFSGIDFARYYDLYDDGD